MMRILRHWKLVLGLLAIFFAGFGTGGFMTVKLIQRIVSNNANMERWVNARMKEYDQKLHLTPEQEAKIRPVMEKAGTGFQGIVKDGFAKALPLVDETHREVRAVLTPEQQVEFDKQRQAVIKRWEDMARKEVLKAPPKGI